MNRAHLLVLLLAVAFPLSAAADSTDKDRRRNLERIAHGKKAEERAEAAEGLSRSADAESVAALTKALEDPSAPVRAAAAGSLWDLHEIASSAKEALQRRLDDGDPEVLVTVAGALEAMDVEPALLVPARRRALAGASPWARYLAALELIGQAPAPEVLQALADQYRRDQAVDAVSASVSLSERLRETEQAIGKLADTQDRALVPPLLALVRTEGPGRARFVRALGRFSPPPDGWRETLLGLLGAKDAAVQIAAIDQLRGMKDPPDFEAWAPRVAALIRSPDVRRQAIDALGGAGARSHAHVAAIVPALRDKDEEVRMAAAKALGQIGHTLQPTTPAVKDAVAAAARGPLEAVLRDDAAARVRVEAANSLDDLAIPTAEVAKVLAEAVTRPQQDGLVRDRLLVMLRRRGAAAHTALPLLEAFLPRAGTQRELVASTIGAIRGGAGKTAGAP